MRKICKNIATCMGIIAVILFMVKPMGVAAETPKSLEYDSNTGYFSGAFESDGTYMRIEIYTTVGYLNSKTWIDMTVGSTAFKLTSTAAQIEKTGDNAVVYMGKAKLEGYDNVECSILQVSVPAGTVGWTVSMPVSQNFKEFIIEQAVTPVNEGKATITTTQPIRTLSYYINSSLSEYTYDDIDDIVNAQALISVSEERSLNNLKFQSIEIPSGPVTVDNLAGIITLFLFFSVIGTCLSIVQYIRIRNKYTETTSAEYVKEANTKMGERKARENEILKDISKKRMEEEDYTDEEHEENHNESDYRLKVPLGKTSGNNASENTVESKNKNIVPGDYVISETSTRERANYFKVENKPGDIYLASSYANSTTTKPTTKPATKSMDTNKPAAKKSTPKWAQGYTRDTNDDYEPIRRPSPSPQGQAMRKQKPKYLQNS